MNENARVLKAPTLSSIMDASLKFLLGNRVMAAAATAIGSTASNIANGAVDYMVNGQIFSLSALAAGTAFTDLTVQLDGTTKLYLLVVDAAGTQSIVNGETLPSDGQPSDLRVPACPLDHCPLGVVKVATAGADFVPGTTLLSAGTVTDTYYDIGIAVDSVV